MWKVVETENSSDPPRLTVSLFHSWRSNLQYDIFSMVRFTSTSLENFKEKREAHSDLSFHFFHRIAVISVVLLGNSCIHTLSEYLFTYVLG